jgi:dipeptidyl aminopeptidase/acylaminoacyl peptidase
MQLGLTVSEYGSVTFSKSGNSLFFGTAAIQPPKDTTLVDFELAKLDVWHYNDDYLQTQQLFNLQNELKRSYPAMYDFGEGKMFQLGSKELPTILQTAEGDGTVFYAVTDTGRRVASQWSGQTKKDIYAIDVRTGKNTLIKKNHDGALYASPTGKYLLLYDNKTKGYTVWDGKSIKNITSKIKVPLYNEENDVPDDPNPYGIMGWHQADSFVYIYDRYDVWKVDPTNIKAPKLFVSGRAQKNVFRYVKVDPEERFITASQPLFFRLQNQTSKMSNIYFRNPSGSMVRWLTPFSTYSYNVFQKAKDAASFIYTRENYINSPDLFYVSTGNNDLNKVKNEDVKITQLSTINPQQSAYNWGTAELYKWKTFSGKESTGILYKPEDFDASKKYPMLIYFYEKLSDGLYNYTAPSPTPSRLNIPFFVSRGYLVFAPDISYTKGNPGKDAYNYIVSGAQALAKNKWVDAKNIGIQGQSWGGYQVAYLITATNMFKAAWAGAPVVNMTSAYGGIRWESGNNRQSQYEKGQSRIGASLWERPDLYIANSPLFHLPKVQTPLVIMANDADGAVPWYQGIEFFTAMRRLNKKVWLLSYNGEAHILVERRNRNDIQIREQEFFDWMLKGEKPAKWLAEGVPAVKKGKDWGLELEF